MLFTESNQDFSPFNLVHTPILILKHNSIVFANQEALAVFKSLKTILDLFPQRLVDKKTYHIFIDKREIHAKCELSVMSKSLVLATLTIMNCGSQSRYKSEYQEICKLGKGAFGYVTKVKHLLDHQIYAVKKIRVSLKRNHPSFSLTEDALTMENDILKEVVLFAKISHHPNVIRYYSAWLEPKIKDNYTHVLCIQMDYPGDTLRMWMDDRTRIDESQNTHIFHQICTGLYHIHSFEIVHKDLSPSNIFIEVLSHHIYIGDFGLSEHVDLLIKKSLVNTHGTPTYASPEIMGKSQFKIGKYADCYSLGIILFELYNLFNTNMERAIAISNLKKGIFDDGFLASYPVIASIIKNLLNYRPEERYTPCDLLQLPEFKPKNSDQEYPHSWSGIGGDCMSSLSTGQFTQSYASSPQSMQGKTEMFRKYLTTVFDTVNKANEEEKAHSVDVVAAMAEDLFTIDLHRDASTTPVSDINGENDGGLMFELQ
eukprot:NODE_427_length_8836_cov_0.452215.p1 type:complete len:484 gc:universal NODE_427_length_8836_cov_0.452215:4761-6212(+)